MLWIFRKCPLWALLLTGLTLANSAFAASNSCAVAYQKAALSQQEIATLKKRGFSPLESQTLNFGIMSLRNHVDGGRFALEKTKDGQFKFHFEVTDHRLGYPILSMTIKAGTQNLPTCEAVRQRLAENDLRRQILLPAIRYVNGDRGASFLDAVIALEKLSIKEKIDWPKVEAQIKDWKDMVSNLTSSRSGQAPLEILNAARVSLIQSGLKNYCQGAATLAELATKSCANCVAQTVLILGIYSDLKLEVPEGWQYGFAVYDDHVQPVLFHSVRKIKIDLMYNRVSKVGRETILEPKELVRMGLARQARLIWIDKVPLEPQAFLARPLTATLRSLVGLNASSLPGNDLVFAFEKVHGGGNFSEAQPPDKADLSWAMDADYSAAPQSGVNEIEGMKLNSNVGNPTDPEPLNPSVSFGQLQFVDLPMVERRDYEAMNARGSITIEDLKKYGVKDHLLKVAGLSPKFQDSLKLQYKVLEPFQIALDEKLRASFKFEAIVGLPTLVLSDRSQFDLFGSVSLTERYRLLVGMIMAEIPHELAAVEEMIGLLNSPNSFAQLRRDPKKWSQVLGRINNLGYVTHGQPMIGRLRALLKPEILLVGKKLNEAFHKGAKNWADHHEGVMQELSNWSEAELIWLTQWLADLQKLTPTESIFAVPAMTLPLLKAVIYDKHNQFSGALSESERQFKQTHLNLTSESIQSSRFSFPKLPEIELQKLPLPCEKGQSGWVQNGVFVYRCGDESASEVGARPVKLVEVPPAVMSTLILTSVGYLFHPGHLVMLNRTMSEATDKSLTVFADQVIVGPPGLKFALTQLRNLTPLILSQAVAESGIWHCKNAICSEQMNSTFSADSWLTTNPLYAEAYEYYQKRPMFLNPAIRLQRFSRNDGSCTLPACTNTLDFSSIDNSFVVDMKNDAFYIHAKLTTTARMTIQIRWTPGEETFYYRLPDPWTPPTKQYSPYPDGFDKRINTRPKAMSPLENPIKHDLGAVEISE